MNNTQAVENAKTYLNIAEGAIFTEDLLDGLQYAKTAVDAHEGNTNALICALRKLREFYTDNESEEIQIIKEALKKSGIPV
jgi:hypothetical protein